MKMIIKLASIEYNMSEDFSRSYSDLRAWSLSLYASYSENSDIFSTSSCNKLSEYISRSWSTMSMHSL